VASFNVTVGSNSLSQSSSGVTASKSRRRNVQSLDPPSKQQINERNERNERKERRKEGKFPIKGTERQREVLNDKKEGSRRRKKK